MTTVKQIERFWNSSAFGRLVDDLLSLRPECAARLKVEFSRAEPCAALVLLRLDEIGQAWHPFNQTLIHTILGLQQTDGGWSDPLTTAICLKALLGQQGHGQAIDAGMRYLANLQKSDGLWPNEPIRRMPADSYVSAYILMQLGDSHAFRQTVRFSDAVRWFQQNCDHLDGETGKLWTLARRRVQSDRVTASAPSAVWS